MRAARADRLLLVLACLCCAAAGAAELGTLFHSAEERDRLDRLRRGGSVSATPSEPTGHKEITGFVVRSDGRGTAFIDGAAVPVDPRAAKLLDPKSVRGQGPRNSEDLKIERKPPR